MFLFPFEEQSMISEVGETFALLFLYVSLLRMGEQDLEQDTGVKD